jgi:hypothetical protein
MCHVLKDLGFDVTSELAKQLLNDLFRKATIATYTDFEAIIAKLILADPERIHSPLDEDVIDI